MLFSAASFCAVLDNHVSMSQGISFIIPATDPLVNISWQPRIVPLFPPF
jgi:hypothetical protein